MDVILVRRCFIGVMSTTCILHMQWYAGSPHYRCAPMFSECSLEGRIWQQQRSFAPKDPRRHPLDNLWLISVSCPVCSSALGLPARLQSIWCDAAARTECLIWPSCEWSLRLQPEIRGLLASALPFVQETLSVDVKGDVGARVLLRAFWLTWHSYLAYGTGTPHITHEWYSYPPKVKPIQEHAYRRQKRPHKKVDYQMTKKNAPPFVHCLALVLLEPQMGGYSAEFSFWMWVEALPPLAFVLLFYGT
jgi:hypothetical protein